MLFHIKVLLVIVLLAGLTFRFARSFCLQFMAAADFERRRNTWFLITAAGLLAPDVWTFYALCIPILLWSARRESNPAALYVMLLWAMPPFAVRLLPSGQYLLPVSFRTLVCLFVMVPAAWRIRRGPRGGGDAATPAPGAGIVDLCVFGFFVFSGFHYIQAELAPGVLAPVTTLDQFRRVVVNLMLAFVPYYVISRVAARSKTRILEVIATFCLACAVLAVLAMYEILSQRLLYTDLIARFTNDQKAWALSYLIRDGLVRAQVSAGHALFLGLVLAVAFGFGLSMVGYARTTFDRLWPRVACWGGLLAAYSRGPWVGGLLVWLLYSLGSPGSLRRLTRMLLALSVAFALLLLTPWGDRIIRLVPALSDQPAVDVGNIDYREQLLDRAIEIYRDNPLLGDPQALLRMQDLRQGQGIIDLVNVYASLAAGSGTVGLFLYVTPALAALLMAWYWSLRWRREDPLFSQVGVSLAAGIAGVLVMIGSSGGDDPVLFCLVAVSVAYAYLGRTELGRVQVRRPQGLRKGAKDAIALR